jgi:hypothetical protein
MDMNISEEQTDVMQYEPPETLARTNETTRCHKTENNNPSSQRRENLITVSMARFKAEI